VQKVGHKKFSICIKYNNDRTFIFKATDKHNRDEWVKCINASIKAVQLNSSSIAVLNPIRTEFNSKAYWRKESITSEEFLKTVDSGDIILFRKHAFMPKMQRTITNSEYDHVAMLVIAQDGKERKLLMLESVYYDGGVRLIDLSDPESFNILLNSHTKLVYRKLNGVKRDQGFIDEMEDAIYNVLDKKYGMHFFNFWRRSNVAEVSKTRSFHCAELVAKMYKMIGLIESEKGS